MLAGVLVLQAHRVTVDFGRTGVHVGLVTKRFGRLGIGCGLGPALRLALVG